MKHIYKMKNPTKPSLKEIKAKLCAVPVAPTQIWRHKRKGTLYVILNVSHHVDRNVTEITYRPVDREDGVLVDFTRDFSVFIQKFAMEYPSATL